MADHVDQSSGAVNSQPGSSKVATSARLDMKKPPQKTCQKCGESFHIATRKCSCGEDLVCKKLYKQPKTTNPRKISREKFSLQQKAMNLHYCNGYEVVVIYAKPHKNGALGMSTFATPGALPFLGTAHSMADQKEEDCAASYKKDQSSQPSIEVHQELEEPGREANVKIAVQQENEETVEVQKENEQPVEIHQENDEPGKKFMPRMLKFTKKTKNPLKFIKKMMNVLKFTMKMKKLLKFTKKTKNPLKFIKKMMNVLKFAMKMKKLLTKKMKNRLKFTKKMTDLSKLAEKGKKLENLTCHPSAPVVGPKKAKSFKKASESEKLWKVERVERIRKNKQGKLEFLIKWQDWEQSFNSWEPQEHLLPDLVINAISKILIE
eukprot:gene674-1341_t